MTASQKPRRARVLGAIAATIVVGTALLGISYRIWLAASSRATVGEVYPRLERLIAIYSLLAWRHPNQIPPLVTEDSEWGGRTFELDCSFDWASAARPGDLFDCFQRTIWIPCDGCDEEELEAFYITPNEDYWYQFSWESLFGYEMQVEVSPESGPYQWRDEIQLDPACAEEAGESFCEFTVYVVEISPLQASGSITFLAANGYPVELSNGAYDRADEWVVYLDGVSGPVTSGTLNRVIQITLRQLQVAETNIAEAAPELEANWMSKDRRFLNTLFSELENVPDLGKISKYLEGS